MSVIDLNEWKAGRRSRPEAKQAAPSKKETELFEKLDRVLTEIVETGPYKGVVAFFPRSDINDTAYLAGGDIDDLDPMLIGRTMALLKERSPKEK